MKRWAFFKEGIKNLKQVGTVTRSSKFVCKEMLSHIDFSKAKVIVELGAGDGVITKHILKQMRPDAKLITFEIMDKFIPDLQSIQDERLIVAHDSAERMGYYLEQIGADKTDAIVSALPFVLLPDTLREDILQKSRTYLVEGGPFVQLHYSLSKKKYYKETFGNVDVNFVPLNIPPAFVLVSEKRA